MSRLYDTIEPSVICMKMLLEAAEDQGPQGEQGKLARTEPTKCHQICNIRLDYRNILKMSNLWPLQNVVKLQMDNNIIEKIEGLESLEKLEVLDLSFNNIEVIEGLDNLKHIEELSLHNNRINIIEKMDSLVNLQIFSIGSNNLTDTQSIIYLRKFSKLKSLNLQGNPICEDSNYLFFTYAHLPNLSFLDYKLIKKKKKMEAFEQYEDKIKSIETDERQEERQNLASSKEIESRKEYTKALVTNFHNGELFNLLCKEDNIATSFVDCLPGYSEIFEEYKTKFCLVCGKLFETGLVQYHKRQAELEAFFSGIRQAKSANREIASKLIEEFMAFKMKFWEDIKEVSDDSDSLDNFLLSHREKTSELWDSLMGLELQLVDQLEDCIKEFEQNIEQMVHGLIEANQTFFTQLREIENVYNEQILEHSMYVMDKILKNDTSEEISMEIKEIFSEKDSLTNLLGNLHDNRLHLIDDNEDNINKDINAWLTKLMDDIHFEEEVSRNRNRIMEINKLIDQLRAETDGLELNQNAF